MKLRILVSLLCIYCIVTVPLATFANTSFKIEVPITSNYNQIPNSGLFEKANSTSLKDALKNVPSELKLTAGDCKKEINFSQVADKITLSAKNEPLNRKEFRHSDLEKVQYQIISTEKIDNNGGEKTISKYNFSEIPNAKYKEIYTESIFKDAEQGGKTLTTKIFTASNQLLKETTFNLSNEEAEKLSKKTDDKGKSVEAPIQRNAIIIELLIALVILDIIIIGVLNWAMYCRDACWNPCAAACAAQQRYFHGATGSRSGLSSCSCSCSCGASWAGGGGPTPTPVPTPIPTPVVIEIP